MDTAQQDQRRPWHAAYGDTSPELPPIPTRTLSEVVEEHARQAPDAPCVEYLGVSLNYQQLDQWGNRFANMLRELGAARGDVIGLHLPNTPQYLIGLLGAAKLGCVVSGVSPLLTADELAYQVENAGIRFLVSLDRLFPAAVAPNDGKLPGLKTVLVTSPIDFLPGWKKVLARLLGKVPKVAIPPLKDIPTLPYWQTLQQAPDGRVYTPVELDEVVLIQYTGGTTGRPKGAELTLRNVQSNAVQTEALIDYELGRETFASVFPYFHAAGLGVALMSLRQRARVLVIPDPRDLQSFCKAMKQFPPTMMGNVPTLYQMLLEEPGFREVDFSKLKIAMSGAAPAPVELIRRVEQIIGEGKYCEVYGLTETSPLLTANPPGRTRPGTVGVPIPGTDIRIVDAESGTREMPFNEPGELIAHGPQVFRGYLGLPEESARALREFDGKTFFHTGDIASMDEDGYITIRDRAKDMLIVGGYKVFSVELENKLKEVEDIELSAVVGSPDEQRPGSEVVNLYVQLSEKARAKNPGTVKEEILAYCQEHMAPYKVPRHIHIVDEIPLTPVGKIDKKALRG